MAGILARRRSSASPEAEGASTKRRSSFTPSEIVRRKNTVPKDSVACLSFTLVSASGLVSNTKHDSACPYVKMYVDDEKVATSEPVQKSLNPVWSADFQVYLRVVGVPSSLNPA